MRIFRQTKRFCMLTSLTLGVTVVMFSQSTPTTTVGTGQPDRNTYDDAKASLFENQHESGANKGIPMSDLGIQQVVEQKKREWQAYFGANTSYFHRSNALSVNEPIGNAEPSTIFSLSGYVGFHGRHYTFGGGVLTPYIGISVTKIQHLRDLLEWADYRSENVYALVDYASIKGWTFTPALDFSRTLSSDTGNEDYRAWSPSLSLSQNLYSKHIPGLFNVKLKTAWHITKIDTLGVPGRTADQLDNWETRITASYSRYVRQALFKGYLAVDYKDYHYGQNRTREDLSRTLGGSLSYRFGSLKISSYTHYIWRDSDEKIDEYENWDIGISLNANIVY